MSLVLRESIKSINDQFAKLGVKREYSVTEKGQGYDLFVKIPDASAAVGNGYGSVGDAIADLYLDAFDAMSGWAASFKKSADDPLPSKAMYETIRDLTEVAVDGVEARKSDETCLADRLNTESGQYAVSRGQTFVDHYSDAYRGGDLK